MGKNLNFITKTRYKSGEDISISLVGKKETAVNVIFRNNTDRTISKTGYVAFAIDGDLLYFKEETEELGYKMSRNDTVNKTTQIRNTEIIDYAITHSGDYKLLYDRELKLFYINAE